MSIDARPRARQLGAWSVVLALAFLGQASVAHAQDPAGDGPTPGAYRLVVGADAVKPDLQAGTYTLVFQGGQGSLTSEFAGFPGTTCPLTYEARAMDLTLNIGGNGPVDPCTRTTRLQYTERGDGLQVIYGSTDPAESAASDKALFDMTYWTLVTDSPGQPSASPAPSEGLSTASLPTGTWQVALTAEDFAPFVADGTDTSGAAATYVLAFDGTSGTFSVEQDGSVVGDCPFDLTTAAPGQATLRLRGQCDTITTLTWDEAGDELVLGYVSTIPESGEALYRGVFTAKPWSRRNPAASSAPLASQPSALANDFLPAAGTYTVRLGRTDMTPYLSREDAKRWKPTTFTLVLVGDTGSIADTAKGNSDFDADLQISGSDSDFHIVVPGKHTDIHAGWTQYGDGTLEFSNIQVESAMDADAWKGVLGAKPWTWTKP